MTEEFEGISRSFVSLVEAGNEMNTFSCSRWMHKYTKTLGKVCWRKRFFVLDSQGNLSYYKSEITEDQMKDQKGKKKPCKPPMNIKGVKFWRSVIKGSAIELERESKPYIIYSSNQKDVNTWISKFQQHGGIYNPSRVISTIEPELTKIGVEKWSKDHVLDWLSYIPLYKPSTHPNLHPFDLEDGKILYVKFFNGLKGNNLLEESESKSKTKDIIDSIEDEDHAIEITSYIHMLKKTRKCSLRFHHVLRKLSNLIYAHGKNTKKSSLMIKGETKYHICGLLSSPLGMRRSYLSLSSFNSHQNWLNLDGKILSSHNNNKICQNDITDRVTNKFEVKLVFSELHYRNNCQKVHNIISPFFHHHDFRKQEEEEEDLIIEPGNIRIGVVLGGWYFEWNDSSLCIPKRILLLKKDDDDDNNNNTFPTINTFHGHQNQKFGKISPKSVIEKNIVNEVIRWNCTKTYSVEKQNAMDDRINWENKEGNDIDFIEELLVSSFLGIKIKGCLKRFLNSISLYNRKNNNSDVDDEDDVIIDQKLSDPRFRFEPDVDFRFFFGLDTSNEKPFVFESHREFDEFVKFKLKPTPYYLKKFRKKKNQLSPLLQEIRMERIRSEPELDQQLQKEEPEEEEEEDEELVFSFLENKKKMKQEEGKEKEKPKEGEEEKEEKFDVFEYLRYSEKFRNEYIVLQSIDRLFWNRYFFDPKNKNHQPLSPSDEENEGEGEEEELTMVDHKNTTGCPFHHPHDTSVVWEEALSSEEWRKLKKMKVELKKKEKKKDNDDDDDTSDSSSSDYY